MAEAVRELSRFTGRGSEEAKRSLVGLMIMVCDSARMEPVREAMAGGWNKGGTELTEQFKPCASYHASQVVRMPSGHWWA